jgi:hypothetical protein
MLLITWYVRQTKTQTAVLWSQCVEQTVAFDCSHLAAGKQLGQGYAHPKRVRRSKRFPSNFDTPDPIVCDKGPNRLCMQTDQQYALRHGFGICLKRVRENPAALSNHLDGSAYL